MPADYDVLAPIYDETGMNNFGASMTPRALDFVQRNDWMGRQILDLGCGTGASLQYLTTHGYIVTAVEKSEVMLERAKNQIDSSRYQVRWLQQDIRALENLSDIDLAIALNVLNELDSLQEINKVFASVQTTLKSGKLFVFDMYTTEGLLERSDIIDNIYFDNQKDLFIVTHDSFDYEKLTQRRDYTIFRQNEAGWQREQASRILRSYSIKAIATQLSRSGLNLLHVLKIDFKPYSPESKNVTRVIFVAQKR